MGAGYFNYPTLFTLALVGGILGVLMMIPLRRAAHRQGARASCKYPEGAACASVLIAGEKGGDFAKTAFQGVGIAVVYAILQKVFHVIAETPAWVTSRTNKWLPNATVNGEITPEYMGVGYIIGPKIAGVLVAGGVLAWLGLIPLLGFLVPGDAVVRAARQAGQQPGRLRLGPRHPHLRQHRQRHLPRLRAPDRRRRGGGRRLHHAAQDPAHHLHLAARLDPLALRQDRRGRASSAPSATSPSSPSSPAASALVVVLVALPFIPGNTILNKILVALLVIVFGFIFVTVSSRIVGLIGSSSNPISGMTIATLMATAMIFVGLGLDRLGLRAHGARGGRHGLHRRRQRRRHLARISRPATWSGATPRAQQIALFVGAIASAVVIGLTVKVLDTPSADQLAKGITHAIGTEKFPAPQGTLMATLIKGLLSLNLDWVYVLVGVFFSITMELCGVKSLSFAVGLYLPLSTTLPIFAGGVVKGLVGLVATKRKGGQAEDSELGGGSLMATGLVAGGALTGVVVALLQVNDDVERFLATAPRPGAGHHPGARPRRLHAARGPRLRWRWESCSSAPPMKSQAKVD